jgi:predicted extracellular nuclease
VEPLPADPAPGERYSRIYRGHPELIDHILASHLVTHHVGDGDVIAGVPTAPAPVSITDDPDTRRDAPASDHRPLVATIDL